MGAREKKVVFQCEIFKRIKCLNDDNVKCITDHVYYSVCIYIVTRQHAGTLTEDTALSQGLTNFQSCFISTANI